MGVLVLYDIASKDDSTFIVENLPVILLPLNPVLYTLVHIPSWVLFRTHFGSDIHLSGIE